MQMHDRSAENWQKLQRSLILLLFLSLCLYCPSLFHEAFADDDVYLAFANRFLRGSQWSDLYQFFLRPANPVEFLPLRDLTYWLDFRLYGDELGGFHATNLAWYAASGLAAFWLFRELILLCKPAWVARATVLSLCGAVLFMVHPAHVEVVAWIASRKDLVAATLGFLSLAVLARALRRDWPCREMVAAALLLFAACFGKAAAMTNIVFVTALIGVGWGLSPQISQFKKSVYLFLFLAFVALAFLIHLKVGEATGIRIENHPGLFLMLERASRIFSALIGILLFPYPLRFYYDGYQLGDWHWAVTASAALLLFVAFRVLWSRRSLWALGIVLALSPMAIYLQLMPFTTWSLASERFVFVSVAGLALLLIDLFGRMADPAKIGALLLLIVLPSAAVVWTRVDDWGEGRSMLAREYERQPGFHNAIRDRIVFTLLPEKRYAEAVALARELPRSYAVEALLSLIGAEQAYRQMRESESAASGYGGRLVRQDYCTAVSNLRSATQNGYRQMPNEPDVSYNNILRTLDKQLKQRYGDSTRMCAGESAVR
jgi:hypothetical protein